jgi:hypothetical protein
MPPEPRPLLLEKRERARVCACVGRACRSSRRRRLAPRCPFTPDLCNVGEWARASGTWTAEFICRSAGVRVETRLCRLSSLFYCPFDFDQAKTACVLLGHDVVSGARSSHVSLSIVHSVLMLPCESNDVKPKPEALRPPRRLYPPSIARART